MRARGEKPRNMHTQNQPIDQAPRHSSKPGANGGGSGVTPNQKGKMLGGHHARARLRRLSAQPDCTLLGSELLQYPSTPRRMGGEGEGAAGPRSLTSSSSHQPRRPASPGLPRSRTRTESREGPALRASGNGIGRKAARVPPRAGRGGLSRLAGPAPAGCPGSGCVPSCGSAKREQKIGLALCSPGYCSFLPDAAGDWSRSRDVGGSAHARAQPYGWVRRPAAQPAFHQTLRRLALCAFFPAAPPCECEPP